MRYAQGGGLTAQGRARREQVRLEAARRFGQGASRAEVARELRVTPTTASRWYKAWKNGGSAALASKGPAARPRLDDGQTQRLELELGRGPWPTGGPTSAGPWPVSATSSADSSTSTTPSRASGT
ncbi:helix-turn-helix domain-containing protein [Nocardiopsis gilva]|uniref:helix-turn-helix domain-containing protein n=1 Tax=Nocardiopsis gilva TaxID=280236 RepID=UPI0018DF6189|nr:helix-turn-helix domain-containing protein [Nocardiopsis gilva]